MIENNGGFPNNYSLYCDICGEEVDKIFDDFYDAVDYKKEHKWRNQLKNNQWEDICPDCQKIKIKENKYEKND